MAWDNWLSDWANRIELIIDNAHIDSDLTHFPLPIVITYSDFFSLLGDNPLKIAVTDGTTQLNAEVATWDYAGNQAVIWVLDANLIVAAASQTTLYLYFDSGKADNTTYIGVTGNKGGSWPAQHAHAYHFKGINGTLIDAVTGNTGTSTDISITESPCGSAYHYNGSSSYSDVGDLTAFNNVAQFEVLSLATIETFSEITCQWNKCVSNNNNINIYTWDDGGLFCDFVIDGNYLQAWINDYTQYISLDTYFTVKIAYNGNATVGDRLKLFINGVNIPWDSSEDLPSTTPDLSGGAMQIGGDVSCYSNMWPGNMSELFVISSASSDAWNKAEHHALTDNLISMGAVVQLGILGIPGATLRSNAQHINYLPILPDAANVAVSSILPSLIATSSVPHQDISQISTDSGGVARPAIPAGAIKVRSQIVKRDPYILAITGSLISLQTRPSVPSGIQKAPVATISFDTSEPTSGAITAIPAEVISEIALAPRHYWTPDPTRTQVLYIFSLDGQIIPISSCQIRRRNGEPTYMSVVIPDYDTWVDTITAQSGGEMILYKGYRFSDGSIQSQEITRVDYETARFDKGSRQLSISLTGHATTTNDEPDNVTIQGVSYRSVGNDGLRRFRAAVDLWLQPGDTAVVDGESITVGYISYIIDVKQETMEIVEAEE